MSTSRSHLQCVKTLMGTPKRGMAPRGIYRPTTDLMVSPVGAEEQRATLLPDGNSDTSVGGSSLKPNVEYINPGQEDEAEIYGYRRSKLKTIASWLLIIATAGIARLVFHWKQEWMLMATHVHCPLAEASRILVVEHYKKCFVKDIKTVHAKQISCPVGSKVSERRAQVIQKLRDLLWFLFDYSYQQEYSVLRKGSSLNQEPIGIEEGVSNIGTSLDDVELECKESDGPKPPLLPLPTPDGDVKCVTQFRYFNYKKLSYIWEEETQSFYKLPELGQGKTGFDLHCYRGISWEDQARTRIIYGENFINVPVQPIYSLLFLEALNPFYIFQLFSVILWFLDDYIYYASVIVITSALSLISEVYQMHRNQRALKSSVQSSDIVEVLRGNGSRDTIPSDHLVPGDVIVIPSQGCQMHCDAILLQGNAIVNESMLTGEAVPVTKIPIINRTDVKYDEKEHSRHTLYCGTKVIQTRYYGGEQVRAVVTRTGFMTTKGSLVRSIMYPPPVDFKFQQDTYKFILVLVAIASFGFIYTVITQHMKGISASEIAVDSLDLITIVVPPALPMAMTVGILYAIQRLKKKNIFCISPRSINISGVINCICFDKTGTLTEDGLDMRGAAPAAQITEETNPHLMPIILPASLPRDHLLAAMATCHSITVIDSKKVGDPLDLKMFESTGWMLEEAGIDDTSKYDMMMPSVVRPPDPDIVTSNENVIDEPPFEIGILRQFPFSSSLQRMSVITRRLGAPNFVLYCKGSPEMIASLSQPKTVPENFSEEMLKYTNQGYRVLALSWKPLKLSYTKAQRIKREEVESDLHFLGLLVLENGLKAASLPTIQELRNANIRTIMVTGDNMLTALSVARECSLVGINETIITVKAIPSIDGNPPAVTFQQAMVDKPKICTTSQDREMTISFDDVSKYRFAIEGKSWSVILEHFRDVLEKVVVRGSVFARMNPDQKQQLIRELQNLGYYVGMCGDGANDCGALKAAHAGISLSEAEASVASPFTSKESDISCTPILIREGRTALVTSFGIFKYMAAYSLTQFISVMILYSIESNLTDIQFLYIDLFLITVFAFFFGRTHSFDGPLSLESPPSSLMSLAPILSLLLHVGVVITFQTGMFFYVQEQTWFAPFNETTAEEILGGHENYAVFSISQFQYIILVFVFSKGPPFRKSIYTNYFLIGSILITTAFSVYLTVHPGDWFIETLELVLPPENDAMANFFRWEVVLIALCNTLIAVVIEYFIIDRLVCYFQNKFNSKTELKYLVVEGNLNKDKGWPPLTPSSTSHNKELPLDAGALLKTKNGLSALNETRTGIIQYQSSL